MIKKRIGNKIILATIAGMLVLTGMGISESVSSAANTSDTKWEAVLVENYTQVKYTNKRRKDTNSNIYIYWSLTYVSGLSAISVGVYYCGNHDGTVVRLSAHEDPRHSKNAPASEVPCRRRCRRFWRHARYCYDGGYSGRTGR